MKPGPDYEQPPTSRREFLKTSSLLTGGAVLATLTLEQSAHAVGNDTIRVGLIGCGGRGTEAAVNALNAGRDVRLVAMADLFEERLQASLRPSAVWMGRGTSGHAGARRALPHRDARQR